VFLTVGEDALKPCPTITSTTGFCTTCTGRPCLAIQTLSRPCGCPSPVPTVYTSRGCNKACPTGCMATSYIIEGRPERACPTSTAVSDPSSCVPTVTVTTHPGVEGGCKFNCSSDFCIMDSELHEPSPILNLVTLPGL
jgi:hypothetical protein